MGRYDSQRLIRNVLFFSTLAAVESALFALGSQDVDPDLFWHLRVADLIAANGPGPLFEQFSYNSVPRLWFPYSWLAELGMSGAVESLGASALFLVPLVGYLATLLFVALAVVDRAGRSPKAAAVVLIVAALILPFISLRPVALAFPFCAFAAWAVTGSSVGRRHRLAVGALIPVTALLANVHLFFLFPVLLLITWALGEWLEGRTAGGAADSKALTYAGIATVSFGMAILANPFGLGLLKVAFYVLLNDVMAGSAAIVEMRPFYQVGALVLFGTLLLLVWPLVGLVRRGRRPDLRDLLLFGLALVLILDRARFVPLAAFLLAPLAATYAPWPRTSTIVARRFSAVTVGVVLALGVSATQRVLALPPEGDLERYLESRTAYPVAAARFVRHTVPRRSGRVINEMGWGGYLIYALWPEFRVMLDGRTNVYHETVWRDAYVNATRESRLVLLRRAQADAAVLPESSPWAEILEDELGWRRVYADGVAAVWVRPGTALAQ